MVSINVEKWGQMQSVVVNQMFIKNRLPWTVRWFDKVEFLDNKYWLAGIYDYIKIAKEALSLDHNYLLDRFDCDDFSAVLYCYSRYEYGINGIARVIDWLAGHSYNVCMTKNGEFYILEPQNCRCYTMNDRPKRLYKLLLAQIIW